jgi:hypothetical protein
MVEIVRANQGGEAEDRSRQREPDWSSSQCLLRPDHLFTSF